MAARLRVYASLPVSMERGSTLPDADAAVVMKLREQVRAMGHVYGAKDAMRLMAPCERLLSSICGGVIESAPRTRQKSGQQPAAGYLTGDRLRRWG